MAAQLPLARTVRALILEDSEADAALVSAEVQRFGMSMVISRVDSAESFRAALGLFAPDVVISGHSRALDATAAMEILRAVRPTIPFIIVTAALAEAEPGAAIRAGAEDLIPRAYLSALADIITKALAVRRPLRTLTERQIEVLKLIAEGKRTRSIANQLGISIKTVESHRGELTRRLGVNGAVNLVRYAIRVGLIPATIAFG
jgi:DNA-binding NarL/FixJ family response regulator